MKLVVVSMIHEAWGGSEELWAAAAEIALQNNDVVIHSALKNGKDYPKIKNLISKGLVQVIRDQYVPDKKPLLIRAVLKRLYFLKELFINRFNSLEDTDAGIILYIGTAYSIANDFALISLTKKNNSRLVINCQLNFEQLIKLSIAQKQKIITAYEAAQKVYFVSERNMQVAFKQLGRSFANAEVIRNPVNISSTDIVPYPKNSVPQMAMVGNLVCMHKGQDIVIKLLSSQKWRDKEWQLNIYGSGQDEKFLKELVSSLDMQQKIIFHGKVADIRKLWSDNHILLMPSHMEGMPLAVVEAMICGRPVVATDVGGHKEWIDHGIEGYIASSPAQNTFDEALTTAWDYKKHWESMGKLAHTKALNLTDPEAGKTFYEILKEAARAPGKEKI